jgi:phosphatidylglycerophosphate synthase
VSEAWILAGVLDGTVGYPRLADDVCGVPHVLRLACDLAASGAKRVFVVWNGDGPPPDLSSIALDRRLRRVTRLEVVREPPSGKPSDAVVIARADRLFHRDLPRLAAEAARGDIAGEAARDESVGTIAGDANDAVYATTRANAECLAARAHEPGGIARALARLRAIEVPLPYAGFTARASGPRSLRCAERQLVWSLRKAADGLAAKALNRHVSLPITRALCRTPIHPNHVTIAALMFALIGASLIATGGYLAGLAGMLAVELGSIIDGVDGELARLRFQFSRTGQWLDTMVDDVANCAYVSGITVSLASTGATWAVPLGVTALGAFAITQLTQYSLIRFVYRSGDLAAIPWAFQSAATLSRTGWRAAIPKLLKRDFVVTLFVVLAAAGHLDWILVAFSMGAFAFLAVLVVQLARNWHALPR